MQGGEPGIEARAKPLGCAEGKCMAYSNLSTGGGLLYLDQECIISYYTLLPGLKEGIMAARYATINIYVGMALSKDAWRGGPWCSEDSSLVPRPLPQSGGRSLVHTACACATYSVFLSVKTSYTYLTHVGRIQAPPTKEGPVIFL